MPKTVCITMPDTFCTTSSASTLVMTRTLTAGTWQQSMFLGLCFLRHCIFVATNGHIRLCELVLAPCSKAAHPFKRILCISCSSPHQSRGVHGTQNLTLTQSSPKEVYSRQNPYCQCSPKHEFVLYFARLNTCAARLLRLLLQPGYKVTAL